MASTMGSACTLLKSLDANDVWSKSLVLEVVGLSAWLAESLKDELGLLAAKEGGPGSECDRMNLGDADPSETMCTEIDRRNRSRGGDPPPSKISIGRTDLRSDGGRTRTWNAVSGNIPIMPMANPAAAIARVPTTE